MKLSQKTINLLKNFAMINPSIVFEEGSRLRTISEIKNVLADADIEEEIPSTFGIYDLNKFLGVVGMFKEPVLDIQDKFAIVKGEGKQSFKFFFSDPSQLTSPKSDLKLPSEDIQFNITESELQSLKKASATLGAKDLVITPAGEGLLNLTITDLKDATSNSSTLELEAAFTKDDFKVILNTDNLKMLPGDYNVSISGKILTKFVSDDVNYYIAVEHTSKF